MNNCNDLLIAIERYILKADNDLEQTLKDAGYVEPKKTVKRINEIEDQLADAFREESDEFLEWLKRAEEKNIDLEKFYEESWPLFVEGDNIKEALFEVFYDELSTIMPDLVNDYIKQADPELIAEQITQRTTDWVSSWSEELSEKMELSSHEEIEKVLTNTLESGKGISDLTAQIMTEGIRDEEYKARRVAVTEMLRAHSVAQEESILQNPCVESKEWVHTGNHKNTPRENHVAMNGQIVAKEEPFELTGADGITYYPMHPRDSILPPGESVNCHCIHRGIVSEDILGLSLEERQALQNQAIADMDDAWEAELDAQNKAKAGIKEPE